MKDGITFHMLVPLNYCFLDYFANFYLRTCRHVVTNQIVYFRLIQAPLLAL